MVKTAKELNSGRWLCSYQDMETLASALFSMAISITPDGSECRVFHYLPHILHFWISFSKLNSTLWSTLRSWQTRAENDRKCGLMFVSLEQ